MKALTWKYFSEIWRIRILVLNFIIIIVLILPNPISFFSVLVLIGYKSDLAKLPQIIFFKKTMSYRMGKKYYLTENIKRYFVHMKINIFITNQECIVLFKSLRNSKRHNKGNFMSKSNSNKIKLCGGGGNIILFWKRFQRYNFFFRSL